MSTLDALRDVAEDFGTPCYVYDWNAIRERVNAVKSAFGPAWSLSYAVKANPNHGILGRFIAEVQFLDVSSLGEVKRALRVGWPADRLSMTGPAKTERVLRNAVDIGVGTMVLESEAEARRLQTILAASGRKCRALLRVAPAKVPAAYGMAMAGKPTAFGVEEAQAAQVLGNVLNMRNIELLGFHAMSGSQCLQVDAVAENIENCMLCFNRLASSVGFSPSRFVVGPGLGIPYHDGDLELDLSLLKTRLTCGAGSLTGSAGAEAVLEIGRYLVGPCGWYVVRVVEIKRSCGVEIAICDGGMNHHQAACGLLGNVLHRAYPIFAPGKPVGSEARPYMICGPLCTSLDTMARRVMLPPLQAGDLLAVGSSGAYGLTASPTLFLSRDPSREVLVVDGEPFDVSEPFCD